MDPLSHEELHKNFSDVSLAIIQDKPTLLLASYPKIPAFENICLAT